MAYKIKILGIAPYEGLVNLMNFYAQERPDIQLTAILGNMEDGVKIAKENYHKYDVILSRAATASLITKAVPTTVIDIGISYYDALRSIKAAENTGTKTAFVGFHDLNSVAKMLCDLLKIHLDIFSVDTEKGSRELLDKLKRLGYKTIVCDTNSYDHAKLIGLTPILVTSGIENLALAIDNAVISYKKSHDQYRFIAMMKHVLDTSTAQYLIVDMQGECLYSTLLEVDNEQIIQKLTTEIGNCQTTSERSFFITVKNVLYSIFAHFIDEDEEPYIIFRILRSKIPMAYSKYGITIMDKQQAEKSYIESFYSNTELARAAFPDIASIGKQNSSIMITGEIGTGKDRLAHILYAKSHVSSHPLYIVNCAMLNEKSWNFLLKHYDSPFMENGNTIYISNLDHLDEKQQKQLLSAILDSNMHSRDHLIFSCTKPARGDIPHVAMEYTNMLGCIILPITPMREQKDDILPSAGLYIDTLNQLLGKQVVGLEPEAVSLLQEYHWPYNRMQFKRVLKESVLKTDLPYISGDIIRSVLEQESAFADHISKEKSAHTDLSIDLDRPLNDINKDIVQQVLRSCDGNHTLAAKKLGISRTTLWRYIGRS